ncbi:MAG: T9SS type A sorting domain-containing protein, partial [Bacteroidales bacterium]
FSAPVSLGPLDFGPLTVGYDPVSPVTVTITRTGSGSITGLNAVLGGTNLGDFTLGSLSSEELNDEIPEATFTIVPNIDLNPGTYNATVTVTDDGTISESFNVQFEVLDSYAISMEYGTGVTLDSDNPLVYDAKTEGYTATLTEVTIKNTGTGDITNLSASLSGGASSDFEVIGPVETTLDGATNSTTFTVSPNSGLSPGLYEETVTVSADNGVSEHFDVSFEVLVQYAISLNPEGPLDFGIRAPGYDAVTPEEITVTRTGTGNITTLSATLSGGESSDFEITGPVATTLDGVTNSTTFTVSPNAGLSAGSYEETVTVNAAEIDPVNFNVTFMVAAEVTWNGSSGNNWHAAENWSNGLVPDQYVHVIIPSDASSFPVISGANATVNELVIENGASLTVSSPRRLTINSGGKVTVKPGGLLYSTGTLVNNAGSGGLVVESDGSATGSVIQSSSGVQATVQRHNNVQGWHIVAPPVGGEAIFDFINNVSNNIPTNPDNEYAMTHYVEDLGAGAGGWGSYYNSSTSGNLMPGKGYLLAINTGYSAYFTGELPYSGKTVSITRGANGWNAIGNPFSSAMGVTSDAASSENFLGVNAGELDSDFAALYIYDPDGKDYKIINNTENTSGLTDGYIQTGQGFLVKSKTGGGSINFTTSMRDHFSSAPFKSASTNWSKIRLKVSDDNKESTILLAFNSNMTNGLDVTYDAGQYGADPGFRLYSRLVEEGNEVDFAIQALPDYEMEDMIIPVGFDFAEGGEVVFSVEELSMPAGASAVLEDRHLEVFTDLGKTDYIVTLDENSSGTGRFFVHTDITITNAEDIPGGQGEQLEIYSYGKEIFILGEVGHNNYATLFDLLGRQVKTVKLENVDRNSFRVDELGKGIYLVRVSGEGAKGAKRVFIE